jgi:4-carboxymuconolactone decarboxylase
MKLTIPHAVRAADHKKIAILRQIFGRKGLSRGKRLLCAISALQAISDWQNLTLVLESSIRAQSDIRPIYEILLQGYLFCGFPRAIESFYCLNQALMRKKLLLPSNLPIPMLEPSTALKTGKIVAGRINKDKFAKIYAKITELSPDLGYLMLVEGYGNILCRDGVDIKTRELAIVSSLSASGAARQLNSHIRGAKNAGCTNNQILEAILTGLPWIGRRKISMSLSIWSEITGISIPKIDLVLRQKDSAYNRV